MINMGLCNTVQVAVSRARCKMGKAPSIQVKRSVQIGMPMRGRANSIIYFVGSAGSTVLVQYQKKKRITTQLYIHLNEW